ncbi:hypothetical protein BBF96_02930 [Anoxybacter fermentans]|uniref:HTH cro/C1-type domain-containing protein n=1 Tax=Anoxybacter fermentans TaxID=1323375 RepID=A0A3S9SVU5_9FIRM|nr:helix-turn-helix domain-containing protein [Anoxybacter fermentans]AZR72437.1 hypothetical protein BBF96_02930 [Anoxybacter fermentans]
MKEIGQKLREAREEKGLSLKDISEKTRIRTIYLKAIEEGNFDKIPGIIYAKGFIKAYAQVVGLDPIELLKELQIQEDAPDLSEVTIMRHDSSKKIGKILIVLLILAILAAAFFFVRNLWVTIQNETIPQLLDTERKSDSINVQLDESKEVSFNKVSFETEVDSDYGMEMLMAKESYDVSNPETIDISEQELVISDQRKDQKNDQQKKVRDQKPENIDIEPKIVASETEEPKIIPEITTLVESEHKEEITTSKKFESKEKQVESIDLKPEKRQTVVTKLGQSEKRELNQIQVIANETSWVRISVDGKILFQGLIKKGETRLFEGSKIQLRTNNAAGIQVNFRGILLGPFGKKGEYIEKVFGE